MVAVIVSIVLGVLAVLVTFVSYYLYIRGKVYQAAAGAVDDAEQSDKTGEEKLNLAVQQIYALVPAVLKPILSEEFIRQIVQAAFDKIEAYAQKQVQKNTV